MKRVVKFLLIVIVLLIISDIIFGYIVEFQKKIGFKGDYEPIEYVMKKCHEDVLIMGSSIVLNSLNPTIIEDSLGVSCFNAGASGQTMYYYHTILNCIIKRYTPKCVILGVRTAEFADEKLLRYNIFMPYYNSGYSEIDSVLECRNSYDKYLLKSNLYRYNTIWFRILLYNFIGDYERGEKGFIAHERPAVLPLYSNNDQKSRYVSKSKLNLFNDFVRLCEKNKIKLIIYFPPIYSKFDNTPATLEKVKSICESNGITYYDDTSNIKYISHQEWFYDQVHLNKYGATEYTKDFVERLKELNIK